MTERETDSATYVENPTQLARICRENIARLKAFRENPPLAAPQLDYKAVPPATTIGAALDAPKTSSRLRRERRKRLEQSREPVRMTSIAPPPSPKNSASLLDVP